MAKRPPETSAEKRMRVRRISRQIKDFLAEEWRKRQGREKA